MKRRPKNILILTYWSYSEGLIQAYTLPYVRIISKNLPAGSSIYFLTLEKPNNRTATENEAIREKLKSENITWLPFNYKPFGFAAFLLWLGIAIKLCSLIVFKSISVIHCWCTPPGAIGYFLSVFLRRKLVLDSYEPHAEAMVENGSWRKDSIAFRLLFWLERKQTERAATVISATAGMFQYAKQKYGVTISQFFVKPACVDLELFSNRDLKDATLIRQYGLENKVVCVYAGKFGGIYLEGEVFDFFKVAFDRWGDKFRVLLLTNHSRDEVVSYCSKSGLEPEKVLSVFVKHQDIPRYLGLGDFAVTPVKPIETKKYCTPIKDGEYWALGLPVVIPANISDDSGIIAENGIGAVMHRLDEEAYRAAILQVEQIMIRPREETFQTIRSIAKRYRDFEIAEKVYKQVYGT